MLLGRIKSGFILTLLLLLYLIWSKADEQVYLIHLRMISTFAEALGEYDSVEETYSVHCVKVLPPQNQVPRRMILRGMSFAFVNSKEKTLPQENAKTNLQLTNERIFSFLKVNTEPKLSRLVDLIVAAEFEPRIGRSGDVPALALQVNTRMR